METARRSHRRGTATTLSVAVIIAALVVACSSSHFVAGAPAYVLTVRAASLTLPPGARGAGSSTLDGRPIRLDVVGGSPFLVVVTPRWGASVRYRADDAGGGQVMFTVVEPHSLGAQLDGAIDGARTWTYLGTITLDGSIAGEHLELTGGGQFESTERFPSGGGSVDATVHATLVVANDDVPPEAQLAAPTSFRPGILLPWEPVLLTLAEPITGDDVLAHLSPVPFFLPSGIDHTQPTTSAVISGGGWWPSGDIDATLRGGYSDTNGNVGAAVTFHATHFGQLPAIARADFASATEAETWGATTLSAPSGLTCEDGSRECAAIVRGDATPSCGVAGGLFVTVMRATPFRTISFRARAVEQPTPEGHAGAVSPLITAGGVGDATGIVQFRAPLVLSLPAPDWPTTPRDSGWQTLSVTLDHDVTSAGIAIDLPVAEDCIAEIYDFPTLHVWARATVLIDDIEPI